MRSPRLTALIAISILSSSNMAVARYENDYSLNQWQWPDNKKSQPSKAYPQIINNGFTRQRNNRAQRRAVKRGR